MMAHDDSCDGAQAVQLHLRLLARDVDLLRKLAADRDQTLSAVVRMLIRSHVHGIEGHKTRPAASTQ